MRSETYTSNVLSYITLPIPKLLSAEFVYGFFTRDEKLVEGKKPKDSFRADRFQAQFKKSPRYVKVNFSFSKEIDSRAVIKSRPNIEIVRNNLQKIYSAEDIGNTRASTIVIQDTGLLKRINDTIKRSSEIRGISGNSTDKSLELGKTLGRSLNRKLLQDLSTSVESLGANYIQDLERIEVNKFKNVRGTMTSFTISDKFVLDAILSGEKSGAIGPVTSTALLKKEVRGLQDLARSENQVVSSNDYITVLQPVSTREITASEYVDQTELLGCLVYRKEIKTDGSEEIRLLDVMPATSECYVDHEIKYGSIYHYWMHAVYAITVQTIGQNTGQVLESVVLFQSEPSDIISTRTIEKTPPPYPADFSLRWDYQKKQLVLSWAYPVNPQRDIKYFQVFRRSKISESYTLLKEFDFNDSLSPPVRNEVVDASNVIRSKEPNLIYVDSEFKKDSEFIYCLGSVDARGFVSNYSMQIKARFDSHKNKLITEMVSQGNAPRSYPNIFLNQDLFLDSIVTKNKRRVKVYFDPEYLKINDKDGNDLGLFGLEESRKYKISIIDIDRADKEIITLGIKDLRNL